MNYLSDQDLETLSIQGLVDYYNEIAPVAGEAKRNAKFRDKPTALKAVRGLIVQCKSISPGLTRLRAAPEAEDIREKVLADQREASRIAARDGAAPKEGDHPPVAGRKRKKTVADSAVITVLVDNPKRKGSKSFDRFALYKNGMTVGQYCVATGDRLTALRDIDYDVKSGFISVEG